MTSHEKIKLKQKITTEIETLTAQIQNTQVSLKPIKKDCSLDSVDHKMLKQDQDLNLQRLEEANKRLNRLNFALTKIDTVEYGICKECEEDIPLARLELIPESQYCVACMHELGI